MKKHRAFLLSLSADMLMAALGTFGAVFSLVSGFSLPVDGRALFALCLGAAAVCVTLASLKSRGARLLMLAAALGVGALVAVRWWEQVELGACAVAERIWNDYARGYGLSPFPLTLAAGEGERTGAVTLVLGLAGAAVCCYLSYGWVRLGSFLGGALVTAAFLIPSLMLTQPPHWLPLTALVVFYAVGTVTALAGQNDRTGRARLIWLTAPLALALAVGLRAAAPEEAYVRGGWISRQKEELSQWLVDLGEELSQGGEGLIPLPGGSSAAAERVDLGAAGPLRYTGRRVLEITAGYSGRVYLRGRALGSYTGRSWTSLPNGVYDAYLGTEDGAWETINGVNPMELPALHQGARRPESSGSAQPEQRAEQVDIRCFTGAGRKYLYVPYYLAAEQPGWGSERFYRDEYLEREQGEERYRVTVVPQPETMGLSAEAARAEWRYRALAAEGYTALPRGEGHGELLRELFLDGGLDQNAWREYAAGRVGQLLAERCVYDPDTPYTPEGEDFVDYFLEESRRGYCMHFASAAAVLLRELGVPTRYVTGYVADVEADTAQEIRDYAAHAWVEIYLDGWGWKPVEVTPGFDGTLPWQEETGSRPTAAGAQPPRPTAPAENTPAVPLPTPEGQAPGVSPPPAAPTQTPPETDGSAPARAVGTAAAAAAAIAAIAVLARRQRARRWRKRYRLAGTNRAVVDAYALLERLLGKRGGVPGELLAAAQKARFSQHTLTEQERETFLMATARAAGQAERELPWYQRPLHRLRYAPWLALLKETDGAGS